MAPVTFKFFTPRGDCRRVTYDDVPELATINELVDGMVEGRRSLSYRDSEGDIVLLKTSRDVVEAVKDAKDSGSKSIRVQIRLIRECPRNNGSKPTATSNNNKCGGGGRRFNCHRPQWRGRGLFGHPHHYINVDLEGVSEELEEICKHFAPFFGLRMSDTDDKGEKAKTEAAGRASSGSETQPPKDDEHATLSQREETREQVQEPKKAESSPAATQLNDPATASPSPLPIIEESAVAENPIESASGFTFVENEPLDDKTEVVATPSSEPKHEAEDESPDAKMDDKLKLLKEMGFEIPQDVARNMIRELNGRMDLIVRALVANQK